LPVIKAQQPRELIVAVPVGSPERLRQVRRHCDDVVCFLRPSSFWAIGQFYEDFAPVDDEEVVRILRDFVPVQELKSGGAVHPDCRREWKMSVQAEHAKSPAVVRVVEMVGVSAKSWSDAAQQVVSRASKSMRHITGVDVLHSSAVVRDGKIIEYHVNVKVAFVVEPAEMEM
jgi:flavin-binding protein dodecin